MAVRSGTIKVSIYKKVAVIRVSCQYTDGLGTSRYMLNDFVFNYRSKFWRFLLVRDLVKTVESIGIELGLKVEKPDIYRYISYTKGIWIKESIVMDLHKKEGE